MFAQGTLLARIDFDNLGAVNTPELLFEATIGTEITLILFAHYGGAGTNIDMVLHYGEQTTTYSADTEIWRFDNYGIDDSKVLFQAQCPGSGIPLRKGDSIGIESNNNTSAGNIITIFGVTQNIAPQSVSEGSPNRIRG